MGTRCRQPRTFVGFVPPAARHDQRTINETPWQYGDLLWPFDVITTHRKFVFSPMLLKFIRPVAAYFCGVEVHIPCNFVISHVKFSIKPSAYWNIFVTVMKRWWQSFIKCLLWSCFFRFKARYSSLFFTCSKKIYIIRFLEIYYSIQKINTHIYVYYSTSWNQYILQLYI